MNPHFKVKARDKPCRDYWFIPAEGVPERRRWTGAMEGGVPALTKVCEMLSDDAFYSECVMFNNEHVHLFISGNIARNRKNMNWRASAINANLLLAEKGIPENLLYNDLTRNPVSAPLIYALMLKGVSGNCILWLGDFGKEYANETAEKTTLEKMGITLDGSDPDN